MRKLRVPIVLLMIAAMSLFFTAAFAQGNSPKAQTQGPSTLSCTSKVLTPTVFCYAETPVAAFGAIEMDIGAQVNADLSQVSLGDLSSFTNADWINVAPYLTLGVYTLNYAVWAEVLVPQIGSVPVLGDPAPIRVGFTAHF